MAEGPHVYGMAAMDLPEGWTPLEAVVMLKCLDDEGEVALLQRVTENLSTWEATGMVQAAHDQLRDGLRAMWAEEDEDDEEGPGGS